MYYGALVIEYLKNYMKSRLTYRADFWVEVISDLLFQATNLIFILVIFQHTNSLGGWSEAEVIFVYGYFMIPYGIFSCFINLWGFSERYIVKGEMDRVLTRPAYSLFQVILENIDPPSLIGSFVGAGIMGVCWAKLGIPFGVVELLVLLLLVVGSVMIYVGIYTALTSISFLSDAPTGILPLMYNIQGYGKYPVTIYNRTIQVILTWIIPFAFVGVYPASYFLEQSATKALALYTPVMGLAFLSIGILVWNYGVRSYRGAGS